MRPWLHDRILTRRKAGFSISLAMWFRGRLRELPGDVLIDSHARARGIFRPSGIHSLMDTHMSTRRGNSRREWPLIQLELWCRTYIGRRNPATPVALTLASV